ncbi:MAG: sugar transferase [Nannocystaceae bacterium]
MPAASALLRNAAYRRGGKRVFDAAIAGAALLAAAPLLLGVAAAVRVGLGSPVLFRQRRPGKHGRPFTLIKFRTTVPTRATPTVGCAATPSASHRWVARCGQAASTSCRSCGTCSGAT